MFNCDTFIYQKILTLCRAKIFETDLQDYQGQVKTLLFVMSCLLAPVVKEGSNEMISRLHVIILSWFLMVISAIIFETDLKDQQGQVKTLLLLGMLCLSTPVETQDPHEMIPKLHAIILSWCLMVISVKLFETDLKD